MRTLIIFVSLVFPALVHADLCAETTTGVVKGKDDTYLISATYSRYAIMCIDPLEKKAEAFCFKKDRYFLFVGRSFDAHKSQLVFRCIADKKKAEEDKRLRETPVDGGQRK